MILLRFGENRVALARGDAGRHPVHGSADLEVMLDYSARREHPRRRVGMDLHALATSRDSHDLVERQRLPCQHDHDRPTSGSCDGTAGRTTVPMSHGDRVYRVHSIRANAEKRAQATPRSSSAYVIPTRRIPRGPGS